MGLHVRGEHRLAAVVFVADPVENLQPARFRGKRGLRDLRRSQTTAQQGRSSCRGRDLQELLAAQTPLE
jgi:hypothetical protein